MSDNEPADQQNAEIPAIIDDIQQIEPRPSTPREVDNLNMETDEEINARQKEMRKRLTRLLASASMMLNHIRTLRVGNQRLEKINKRLSVQLKVKKAKHPNSNLRQLPVFKPGVSRSMPNRTNPRQF